jgi:hypothetical protein
MRELLIPLVVIVAIAIVWYLWKGSDGGDERRSRGVPRRPQLRGGEDASPAASAPRATSARVAEPGLGERGTGLFQEAADSAAGLRYERAADQMEGLTADLARARQDAEQAAERLASRATDALASIQAAAAAHGGAVPGDGTSDCPSSYPIKGNIASMYYHNPGQPSYNRTIPEVCFQSAEAAEAAGFTESDDEAATSTGENRNR